MLHFETIEPATLALLRTLQDSTLLKDCRLVGGTSLALQIGHRKSIDLDFFGHVDAMPEELEDELRQYGNLQVRKNSGNIHLFVLNGIHVDIVNFPFPWQKDLIFEGGLRLAHIEDIAAMKITAVIGRGTKKDFIDIATLLETYTLKQLLSFYKAKYPNASSFLALKSLSYFEDAEIQPMPYMFSPLSWEETKAKVLQAINAIGQS